MSRIPAIMIAGTHSGVGKTTVVVGLCAALRARGMVVQPFKVGPDYIDPSYHARSSGRPCRNLDSWMIPSSRLLELYERACKGADIAVVEGVMGLFDGKDEAGGGSSAEVAKLLGLPVVLTIQGAALAQSAGALAYGYAKLDPALQVVAVVANGVGSASHRQLIAEAIHRATGLPLLGVLARRPELTLPERRLGLTPVAEGGVSDEFFERLRREVDERFDLDMLLRLAAVKELSVQPTSLFPAERIEPRARIAVASDEAFSFHYQDNLDLLAAWGAELVPFRPLHDAALPDGVGGLLLGGGFPELYARQLSENRAMRGAISAFHAAGGVIYAECGGLMYLCQSLTDIQGVRYDGAGLVPARAVSASGRLSLGYAEVQARRPLPCLAEGGRARGHQFHYSRLDRELAPQAAAYSLLPGGEVAGYSDGANLLASHVHLHFASNAGIAPRLVGACTGGSAR